MQITKGKTGVPPFSNAPEINHTTNRGNDKGKRNRKRKRAIWLGMGMGMEMEMEVVVEGSSSLPQGRWPYYVDILFGYRKRVKAVL